MTVSTNAHRGRAWLEVNLDNLVANAQTLMDAAKDAMLLPMVKADGYGLGVMPVVNALETLHPWGYGVSTTQEGIELREAGVDRPILVFTPATSELAGLYADNDLRAVIDSIDASKSWSTPFHLEIDTGMGRTGIRWDDAAVLGRIDHPNLEGVFTHFHSADEAPATVPDQLARFRSALELLPRRPELVHAANSAGVWLTDEGFDLVRPGIFIYGARCGEHAPVPQPVAALRAPVVSLRKLKRGESVSYGAEWRAPADTTIATLGAGFADGVPRSLASRGEVIIAGRRCPIAGRLTMDLVMVDAGRVEPEELSVGTIATFIGSAGTEEITIDQFAESARTTSYEILVRFSCRLNRTYVRSHEA